MWRWFDLFSPAPILAQRVFPALVSAALISIIAFSNVEAPDLWFVEGLAATGVTLVYATILVVLAVQPKWVALHTVGAPLAVATYGGRAGGFLEIVILHDRYDLIAAVMERVVLALGLVLWHRARTREIVLEATKGDTPRGDPD